MSGKGVGCNFRPPLCVVLVSLSTALVTAQAPGAASSVLFEGARLVNSDGKPPIDNSAFLVENGRFARVGRSEESPCRAAAGAWT